MPVGAERHTEHRVGVAGQGAPIGWPVSASHSRTVWSALAEARRCPSGLNATLFTAPVWPVSGAPIGWPVSASHSRTVWSSPARGQAVPVGAERHARHRAGVTGDDLQGAGPLGHRGIEGAVGGVVLGQRVGGQNLLESPHVPAGDGASQHALGLRDQLLHVSRPAGLSAPVAGSSPGDFGRERRASAAMNAVAASTARSMRELRRRAAACASAVS